MRCDTVATFALSLVLAFAACTGRSSNTEPLDPAAPPAASFNEESHTGLGDPISGLSAAQLAVFEEGDEIFDRAFDQDDGLGPLFNAASCAECHEEGPNGGSIDQAETHVANLVGGKCDELEVHGGLVIQDHTTDYMKAYSGLTHEPVPPQATVVAHRLTPMVFGLGLFEAIPDLEILARADPNDRNHDGVSGRAHILSGGHLGRFGRKATGATLLDFNAGAFQNEMGVTNPLGMTEPTAEGWTYPNTVDPTAEPELSADDLDTTTEYTRMLAPPPRGRVTRESIEGAYYFINTGCATCHVPAMVTGRSPIRALSTRVVTPFSDFLLHDMGAGLADICRGQATAAEFRTEPLLGLHFRARYLHDGRAHTLEQAITQHDGEGTRARNAFARLKGSQKAALIAYLNSL